MVTNMIQDLFMPSPLDRNHDESPDSGEPHPVLAFVLPYLNLEDLLSVEMVCTSLRNEVWNNNLLWRNITILEPLNTRIEDDNFLNLAAKSKGLMESLTLFQCPWITNDALKIVLHNNPKIKKLCVPYCFRITIDDMINNLKKNELGIKLLRVNGLRFNYSDDVTGNAKLDELRLLVSPESDSQNLDKPVSRSGNRPIDIEQCKKCNKVARVYETSPKSNREKLAPPPPCIWTRSCGVCGYCSACELLGLLRYNYICDDCYADTDLPEKIVSSTCLVQVSS